MISVLPGAAAKHHWSASLAGRRANRIVGLCVALALVSLEVGCSPEASPATPVPSAQKDPNAIQVAVDQIRRLSIVKVEPYGFRVQKQAIGQIAFNEDASTVVLTPFSGRVTRVLGKVGAEVKRDDPLFEIDSPEVVQAQTDLIAALNGLERAKSQFTMAQRQLDRLNRLVANNATSIREVDQARNDFTASETDLKTAEGALNAARNRLRVIIGRDQTEVERVERERIVNPLITVNAPIDGTIIARRVGPGQYVRADAGEQLYTISNLSTMWLKANVPEVDIPLVRLGQEVEVRVTALPDRVFRARVIAIGAASDASTRRVVVRSEIPNPDGALKSEMFATFKIVVGEPERAPAVPTNAVIWEGDAAHVWVQRAPTIFERRNVNVGMEQNDWLQIRSGLQLDEQVVARGAVFMDNQWRQ